MVPDSLVLRRGRTSCDPIVRSDVGFWDGSRAFRSQRSSTRRSALTTGPRLDDEARKEPARLRGGKQDRRVAVDDLHGGR
jgi:hypothetical protein